MQTYGLEENKQKEIEKAVTLMKQLDITDISLLTRDANTLLTRQLLCQQKNRKPRRTG